MIHSLLVMLLIKCHFSQNGVNGNMNVTSLPGFDANMNVTASAGVDGNVMASPGVHLNMNVTALPGFDGNMNVTPSSGFEANIKVTASQGVDANIDLTASPGYDGNVTASPGFDANMNVMASPESCLLSAGAADVSILQSTPLSKCTAQITTAQHLSIWIQIPQIMSTQEVVYIHRQSSGCAQRYLMIHGNNMPCSFIIHDEQFQSTLQGNVTMVLTTVTLPTVVNANVTDCDIISIDDELNLVNHTLPDCFIQEYKDIVDHKWNKMKQQCSFQFPPDCNVTLGFREVTFHCLESSQDHSAILDYPDLTVVKDMNLKESSIVEIGENTFTGMINLKHLRLHFNNISSLPEGVFHGLHKLTQLNLKENQITNLPAKLFHDLHALDTLLLQWNRFTLLDASLFSNMPRLTSLKLFNNKLEQLEMELFDDLQNLNNLDISVNRLVTLPGELFKGMSELRILLLNDNFFTNLVYNLFQDLHSLTSLSLSNNSLTSIHTELFTATTLLAYLDLSHNQLHLIPSIGHLSHLHQLLLEGNTFYRIDDDVFSNMRESGDLIVSKPEICECYTPEDLTCSATTPRSPYLTCDRLLSDRVLVVFMWIIGISAAAGNFFVLCWRKKHSEKNKVQAILLHNLAASDLLMGVYMVFIGAADIHFGDNFPLRAETWRTGYPCKLAGALAIASSEASVFFITLISIDRFISIRYPHSKLKLRKKSTNYIVAGTWAFSAALGLIPSLLAGRNLKFYDNSHVCLGIPLTLLETFNTTAVERKVSFEKHFSFDKTIVETHSTGHTTGMYFSTAVFLGLNCMCYLVILICYIILLHTVYKSAKRVGLNREMKAQIRLTAKVAAIVATDFCTWSPIIILGILVQMGVVTLPPSVFAWSVTVVLPINSAINPYLYTISDIIYNRRKKIHPSDYGSQTQSQGQQKTQATSVSLVVPVNHRLMEVQPACMTLENGQNSDTNV